MEGKWEFEVCKWIKGIQMYMYNVPGRREGSSHLSMCTHPFYFLPFAFSSIPTRQAFLLQLIEVQVSTSAYLLSKVNSSGFSIGYITEVTHGNPRFRFKLCDLNKVLG